jgi:Rrf2 family protein
MVSKKSKYGILACLNLARNHGNGPRLITEIADEEKLPRKFLEAILLELKNAGILSSRKGRGGGYMLGRDPDKIMIGSLVRTLDGPLAPMRCASVTAPVPCEDCADPESCAVRALMRETRDAISGVLDNTTLAQMMERTETLNRKNRKVMTFEI